MMLLQFRGSLHQSDLSLLCFAIFQKSQTLLFKECIIFYKNHRLYFSKNVADGVKT